MAAGDHQVLVEGDHPPLMAAGDHPPPGVKDPQVLVAKVYDRQPPMGELQVGIDRPPLVAPGQEVPLVEDVNLAFPPLVASMN
jgi:hypothetical protein